MSEKHPGPPPPGQPALAANAAGASRNLHTTTGHAAPGGLFSTPASAFASRVAMGHFSHARPVAYTGASGTSGRTSFPAQTASLGGHSHIRHQGHSVAGVRYPGAHSPLSTNAASPPANAGVRMHRHHDPNLVKFRLTSPRSLPPLHWELASVHADYYPHRPEQPEHSLGNETMSARDILRDYWRDQSTLNLLNNTMAEIMQRQVRSAQLPRESSWKPPGKYRVSDMKKEQWLLDLANPIVPLHMLTSSIPSGLRGEKLIDALANRQPPLTRALWSIKAVALAESNCEPMASTLAVLSLELNDTITQFLDMQLAELAGGPRASGAPSMGFMAGRVVGNAFRPWQNEESRQRWTTRWWYSIRLAECAHNEGLVDQRCFLKWLLDRLAISGLEQTVVLLPLVVALMPDIARSRALIRLLIDALLDKLQAVYCSIDNDARSRQCQHIINEVAIILQNICIYWPDALVQPKAWHRHAVILRRVMAISINSPASFTDISMCYPVSADRHQQLSARLKSIGHRNDAFCIRFNIRHEPDSSSLDRILDSRTRSTSMEAWIEACKSDMGSSARYRARIKQLCHWATTSSYEGDGRVFLAVTLLSQLRQLEDSMHLSDRDLLQSALLDFLETSERKSDTLVFLFDALMRRGLFLYTRYLRRLIARGSLRCTSASSSRHVDILRMLPVYDYESTVSCQRRVQLYGIDSTTDPDELVIRGLAERLASKLPYLTANDDFCRQSPNHMATYDCTAQKLHVVDTMIEPLVDNPAVDYELQLPFDEDTIRALKTSSRYCQVRITSTWLMGLIRQFVVKEVRIGIDNWRVITSPGASLLNYRQLATVIYIMEIARDDYTLIDLALWVLEHSDCRDMAMLCIDALMRHYTCWVATSQQEAVLSALITKYASIRESGREDVAFLDSIRYLVRDDAGSAEQVKKLLQASISHSTVSTVQQRHPLHQRQYQDSLNQLPECLNDLRFQPLELDARQVAILAQSVWTKYHNEIDWFARLLVLLQTSLDEHSSAISEPIDARRKLLVFAILLENLMCSSASLRQTLQHWLTGRFSAQEMEHPAHRRWRLQLTALLTAHNCCDITFILEGICLPVLRDDLQQSTNSSRIPDILDLLAAVLFQQSSSAIQLGVAEILSLETRVLTSIRRQAGTQLILSVLVPLVQQEANLPLSDAVRHRCATMRNWLLSAGWLRSVCFLDPLNFASTFIELSRVPTHTAPSLSLFIHSGLMVLLETDTSDIEAMDAQEDALVPLCIRAFSTMLAQHARRDVSASRAVLRAVLVGLQHSSQTMMTDEVVTIEGGHSLSVDVTRQLAYAFFDTIASDVPVDLDKLASLVYDFPSTLMAELVAHASRLLEGPVDSEFPTCVLLACQQSTAIDRFSFILQRMHGVVSILLACASRYDDEHTTSQIDSFVHSLLTQVKQFVDHLPIVTVMAACSLSFGQAAQRYQDTHARGNNSQLAASHLPTAHIGTSLVATDSYLEPTFAQLCDCLELRIRLLSPILSAMLARSERCAVDSWIIVLLQLLSSPLVARESTDSSLYLINPTADEGKTSSFFEFVLDLLSFMLDELPKDLRTRVLDVMRTMEHQLFLPDAYADRIRYVLPFKTRHRYMNAMHAESLQLLDPWRWLEDTSVNSARINTTRVSTPAPYTPNASGGTSTPGENGEDIMHTAHACSDSRNDTPLSLALFRARRIRNSDTTIVQTTCGKYILQDPDQSEDAALASVIRPSPEPGELSDNSHKLGSTHPSAYIPQKRHVPF